MDLGISGRVALVTGASRGIGLGIARALANDGARVAIASRSRDAIAAAAAQIGVHGLAHDMVDLDGTDRLVDEVETALGPVDILVASTGGPPGGPDPLGFSREQWEDAYRTLVLAPLALVERTVPGMRERGWGRILSVGSTSVVEPIPGLMLSNSHRTGLLGALKTVAREVAADGVTVNSVLPGRIWTDRIRELAGSRAAAEAAARAEVPAARLGTVEEMGAAAAFLCSDAASYITGEALRVDGGLTRSL